MKAFILKNLRDTTQKLFRVLAHKDLCDGWLNRGWTNDGWLDRSTTRHTSMFFNFKKHACAGALRMLTFMNARSCLPPWWAQPGTATGCHGSFFTKFDYDMSKGCWEIGLLPLWQDGYNMLKSCWEMGLLPVWRLRCQVWLAVTAKQFWIWKYNSSCMLTLQVPVAALLYVYTAVFVCCCF